MEQEHKHEEKREENRIVETAKIEIPKEAKKEIQKKEDAKADIRDLPMSAKTAAYICAFIKRKEIDKAIEELEQVIKGKNFVPMKGEIPHRKGGVIGRYPKKSSKIFINILKGLRGNAVQNGIENPIITFAKADRASRPHKRFGSKRFKRANVFLIAKGKQERKK